MLTTYADVVERIITHVFTMNDVDDAFEGAPGQSDQGDHQRIN
jgi:hypothetical protein